MMPLPELSNDIPGILGICSSGYHWNPITVKCWSRDSLGYLAAGKNGLSEDELLDVLSWIKEMLADFQRRSPKSPKVEGYRWSSGRGYIRFGALPDRTQRGWHFPVGLYHRQISRTCPAAYVIKFINPPGLRRILILRPLYTLRLG